MIGKYKVGKYGLENETEGMYARTNNGIIGKVINSNSDEMINGPEILVNEKIYCIERDSIKDIKESILDLIEVGDYVNGYPVRRIANFNNELCNFDLNNMEWTTLKDIDIYYNILTKELYQANCYTVERKEEWNIDI